MKFIQFLAFLLMVFFASLNAQKKKVQDRSQHERVSVTVGARGDAEVGTEASPKWMTQSRPIRRQQNKKTEDRPLSRSHRGISMTFAQLHRNKRLHHDVVNLLEEYRNHILQELAKAMGEGHRKTNISDYSNAITYRQAIQATRNILSRNVKSERAIEHARTAVVSYTKASSQRRQEMIANATKNTTHDESSVALEQELPLPVFPEPTREDRKDMKAYYSRKKAYYESSTVKEAIESAITMMDEDSVIAGIQTISQESDANAESWQPLSYEDALTQLQSMLDGFSISISTVVFCNEISFFLLADISESIGTKAKKAGESVVTLEHLLSAVESSADPLDSWLRARIVETKTSLI